jgi:hypothetical protein
MNWADRLADAITALERIAAALERIADTLGRKQVER